MPDSNQAPASLGGVDLDSARTAIREWVGSRLAREPAPSPRVVLLSNAGPATGLETELASILTDAAAATVAAQFESDPHRQRQILTAAFVGNRLDWPIDDRTEIGHLVDDIRHWMIENRSFLKAATGMTDHDIHRCRQELCEHLIVNIGARVEHDRGAGHDLQRMWTRFWDSEIAAGPLQHKATEPVAGFNTAFNGPVHNVVQSNGSIFITVPGAPQHPEQPIAPSEPEEHPGKQKPSGRRKRLVRPMLLIAALAVVAAVPATLMDLNLFPRSGRGDDGPSNEGSDGGSASAAPTEQVGPTVLEAAREACAPTAESVQIGDDGFTMTIERAMAEEDPGIDGSELGCIFGELDMPDAVLSRVQATNSLSGMQDGEWDGFKAFWTFHPERGLHMTIQQVQP